MTTIPDRFEFIRPPAGAVEIGEWHNAGGGLARHFAQTPVDIGDAVLTIHGSQYDNGVVGRSILLRVNPTFEGGDDVDLTPRAARQVAVMLQNFADACDILAEAKR